jgi:phosphoribosylanthranilate isomerase
MTAVRVKICGLTRRPDAEMAAASGAHYGGVILAPGGRRSITPADAAHLFSGLPLRRVGVFVDATPAALRAAAETAALDVLQLHGSESPEAIAELRAGGFEIWKALRPRNADEFLAELRRYQSVVDGILLDAWSAEAAGGTGKSFPWEPVSAHRDAVPEGLRLIVAGGLAPHNVAAAIGLLRPSVVDVSSGVEDSPGVKNRHAVPAFVAAVHAAAMDPTTRS